MKQVTLLVIGLVIILDFQLEEWWYDAYVEIRQPLTPYLSQASCSSFWYPLEGTQICRAADIVYHLMRFREKIRNCTLPITRSRGMVWDMYQYYCLFNASRIPALPKDRICRYFKTESEGSCPSHITVLCRGNIWSVELYRNDQLITPDELHNVLSYIDRNSADEAHCVASLTTERRDIWAKLRQSIIARSSQNASHIQTIEESCFCLTLTDNIYETKSELLHAALMGETRMQWADKCLNLIVCKDGQLLMQGDHSNVDAIVVLHACDDAAHRARKIQWFPQKQSFRVNAIKFDDYGNNLKQSFRVNAIKFDDYGNNLVRKSNLYMDTVIQIGLQLAFLKTHGSFAPIYETASTRKFYHGRTETVRGCTQEMLEFGRSIINESSVSKLTNC
ncbi:Choline/Carnitine O-acyltransferase [Dictyocaulus viviparus]|uniref:Choline/Carnitine O-acyltransferase n=1 Tax=Dictyocaulus viviparus TaxID=29172 RepID=A0A0D8XRV4_DICVI|nr:Choline/Carnitine O-acyltransferase [Dictyocaulus viviparus]